MSRSGPGILFISHDSGRTGAPIGLLAFMQWLHANTHYRIGTILRAPGPLEPSFRALGPTLTLGSSFLARSRFGRRLRRRLPRSLQEERGSIRRFFAKGDFQLIYSNTMTNGLVLDALAGTGVPVVTHVHELAYWISRAGPENLRQVIAHSTAYVAAAQAVRNNLRENHQISAEKISVVYEHIRELPSVPSAADRIRARKLLGIPDGAIVVGGCGAEHWRKGRDLIPLLLVALRRYAPAKAVHFVWIGRPGNDVDEVALAHDLRTAGVETLFRSSGEVDNPFELFPAVDVFALLSRDDPYPLAALEVAATETPILCFDGAGGMPEFVQGDCGFAAPYLDLDAMASAVVRLTSDSALRAVYGRNARRKVATENLLATTGPQLLAVIERQLAVRRTSAAS